MNGVGPEISVVIVSSRPIRLAFALDALARQTVDASRFEVVVVRDPASPDHSNAERDDLNIRWFVGPERANIAALRNLGWRSATAPLIAYTDDDCRPTEDWLERLLNSGVGTEEILQGRTEPDPDERHLLHGLARSMNVTELSPWLPTCNILYPRSVLEQLGGFDERFDQLGEDTDLGIRATAASVKLRYFPEALVYHAVIPRTLRRAVRDDWRRSAHVPVLISRHPSHRRTLYAGVFWRRSHGLLLLALAGTALLPGRRLKALAWLPYIRAQIDIEWIGHPRRLVHASIGVGERAILDAVEIASMSRRAASERTLVL